MDLCRTPGVTSAALARLLSTLPGDIAEALGLIAYEGGDSVHGEITRRMRTPDVWHGTSVLSLPAPPQDGAMSR